VKRWVGVIALLLAVYVLSGLYVVRGNEKAVVRRFGRVCTTEDGRVRLFGSGLHYALPSPLAVVDRVNLNEIHTVTIGITETEPATQMPLLEQAVSVNRSQFLTGDQNILHVQLGLQYRISEEGVRDYLFASESADRRLALLVESAAVDLIAQSGVDFVHPLGLGQLREMLTQRTRELANEHRLGLDVEEVAINAVYPPVRVKAYFLDVSNARADKDKYINAAHAYAEQQSAAARADAQKTLDAAEMFRQQRVEFARGAADSFTKLVERFRREEQQGIQTYQSARQMAMQRRYLDTMEGVLRRVASKVLLDSGKEIDLTIFRDPTE
jgi:membrane protease subunit HflK